MHGSASVCVLCMYVWHNVVCTITVNCRQPSFSGCRPPDLEFFTGARRHGSHTPVLQETLKNVLTATIVLTSTLVVLEVTSVTFATMKINWLIDWLYICRCRTSKELNPTDDEIVIKLKAIIDTDISVVGSVIVILCSVTHAQKTCTSELLVHVQVSCNKWNPALFLHEVLPKFDPRNLGSEGTWPCVRSTRNIVFPVVQISALYDRSVLWNTSVLNAAW